MSFLEKTENEVREEVFNIAKQETELTNFNSVGVLRGIAETISRVVIKNAQDNNSLLDQTNIDTATGAWLSQWGMLVGVARKPAIKAQGNFEGDAYSSGTVPKGSWINVEGTTLKFKVTEEVIFSSGVFGLPVEAEFEGSEYNISSGISVRITNVISGLNGITVPVNWITRIGEDEEDDESYRQRIKDRWNSLGEQAPPSKYKFLAESVSGAREAKILRTPRGPGSTDVVIAAINGIPSTALLEDVRSVLDDRIALCRDLVVRAPNAVIVNISLNYKGDYTENEIELKVNEYFNALLIGEPLLIAKLYNHIWMNLVLESLEITSPSSNVICQQYELIIPGTVIITKEV